MDGWPMRAGFLICPAGLINVIKALKQQAGTGRPRPSWFYMVSADAGQVIALYILRNEDIPYLLLAGIDAKSNAHTDNSLGPQALDDGVANVLGLILALFAHTMDNLHAAVNAQSIAGGACYRVLDWFALGVKLFQDSGGFVFVECNQYDYGQVRGKEETLLVRDQLIRWNTFEFARMRRVGGRRRAFEPNPSVRCASFFIGSDFCLKGNALRLCGLVDGAEQSVQGTVGAGGGADRKQGFQDAGNVDFVVVSAQA